MAVELNYSQFGETGEPLIIMHGLFGSARNWQGVAKQLSDRYTVYTLDLRNHGASPHAEVMDYEAMSADVLEFMQSEGIKSATVLGHSMGGKVAMNFALSFPEKVNKLIVVDIAPVIYQHKFDDVLAGIHHVPLDSISTRKEADNYMAEKIDVQSLRQFLLQNLVGSSSDGFAWRVNLPSIEKNMPNIMGFPEVVEKQAYEGATLVINGAQSTYVAPRHKPIVASLFPKASFQTIAKSGHWPHIESPTEFMSILNKFLNE
jgi:esterase